MSNIQAFSNHVITPSNGKMDSASIEKNKMNASSELFYNDFMQTLSSSFLGLKDGSVSTVNTINLDEAIQRQNGNEVPEPGELLDEALPPLSQELADLPSGSDENLIQKNSVDNPFAEGPFKEEPFAGSALAHNVGLKSLGLKSNEPSPSLSVSEQSPLDQQKSSAASAESHGLLSDILIKEKELANIQPMNLDQSKSALKSSNANLEQNSASNQGQLSNGMLFNDKQSNGVLSMQIAAQTSALSLPEDQNSFTQHFKAVNSSMTLSQAMKFNYADLEKEDMKNSKLNWESKLTETDGKSQLTSLLELNGLSGRKQQAGHWSSTQTNGLMQANEHGSASLSKPMNQYLNSSTNGQAASSQNVESQSSQNALPQIIRSDLKLSTMHPQWDKAFNQRIVMMQKQQHQLAEIRLNPVHMGPIKVSIQKGESESSIQMWASNAQTREQIEQALPKLKEMLLENGSGEFNLEMSDFSNYSQQSQHSEQTDDSSVNKQAQNKDDAENIDESLDELVEIAIGSDNRVDFYA
jgi:flagellar hook-length control protein FliK